MRLNYCMLGSLRDFKFVVCSFFSKSSFSKISFRNTIRVSNSLDPDQARRCVGPDLGPSCSQALSADGTGRLRINPCPAEQIKMAHSLLFSSKFSCVFVRVCLFVPSGHVLGKG